MSVSPAGDFANVPSPDQMAFLSQFGQGDGGNGGWRAMKAITMLMRPILPLPPSHTFPNPRRFAYRKQHSSICFRDANVAIPSRDEHIGVELEEVHSGACQRLREIRTIAYPSGIGSIIGCVRWCYPEEGDDSSLHRRPPDQTAASRWGQCNPVGRR
jgi:hypothetical protein